MGVILYVLYVSPLIYTSHLWLPSLVGYPPFGQSDFDAIRLGRYNFDHSRWKKVSAAAKDLVSNLLVVNPAKRFTIENILDHAWIKVRLVIPFERCLRLCVCVCDTQPIQGDFDAFAKPVAKATKRKSEKGTESAPTKTNSKSPKAAEAGALCCC